MAEYDFNAPIDVEMIFEDSDNDDPSIQSALSEHENINENNKQAPVEQCVTKPKTDNKQFKDQINIESLNKSMLSLNQISNVLPCKHSIEKSKNNENNILNNKKNAEIGMNLKDVEHCHNQNESDANQHALILLDNDTVNEGSLPSTSGSNDHHEPVTTFIEDLLNKLSEHIVLIMQSFYHYGVKRNNEDNKKREDVFHFIKSHFFELSYSTVESIFLPQEQNESFINQFLDNTVLIANNKALRWRCHRGHVRPFFKELMTWTKEKKQYTKNNHPPGPSNGNILLKEQLVRPLLPLNLPQSEIIANSNIATQNIQNNLCIFSSGPPGSEISINIDAKTLMQINKRQQSTDRVEQNKSNNNTSQNCDSTSRKKPVTRTTNRNRVKNIQKRNPQYDRLPPAKPPPPPYYMSHGANRMPYRPQQYNQTNMNPIRNHYDNIGPPQQNHQNIGQPINNHPNQLHYVNTNHISPPHNGCLNYLYNNPNRNISTVRFGPMEY